MGAQLASTTVVAGWSGPAHEAVDEAVASLDVVLSEEEVRTLEAPYTPRYDLQGVSDEAELDAIRARVPGMALRR